MISLDATRAREEEARAAVCLGVGTVTVYKTPIKIYRLNIQSST